MAGRAPVEIVVSRYDEPIGWLDEYRTVAELSVYQKGNRSDVAGAVPLPNVGRESHTFLHHIVSNYDNLANWTVFTQANPPSFGYKGHRAGGGHLAAGVVFADYLHPRNHSFIVYTSAFRVGTDGVFCASLRDSYVHEDRRLGSLRECPRSGGWGDWWRMGWFQDMLEEKVRAQRGMSVKDFFNQLVDASNPVVDGLTLAYAQGARAAVARGVIRARPRSYYERLLHLVAQNNDPWAGYYLEWMWPVIFGRLPSECRLPPASQPTSFEAAASGLEQRYRDMWKSTKDRHPRILEASPIPFSGAQEQVPPSSPPPLVAAAPLWPPPLTPPPPLPDTDGGPHSATVAAAVSVTLVSVSILAVLFYAIRGRPRRRWPRRRSVRVGATSRRSVNVHWSAPERTAGGTGPRV